jgi:hypothetical protein
MSARFKSIVAVFITCSIAVLAVRWRAQTQLRSNPSTLEMAVHPESAGAIPAFIRSLRPIYPYSVIPGGVFSQGELKARLQADSVARQHYAEFDVEHARLVSLTQDRFQYVSYRVHDKVFWTRKQLRIPRGEILLTDGKKFARTRCGNLLSETPQARVDGDEETSMIDFPPLTKNSISDRRIGLLTPPEIQIPSEIPPQLTDLFALAAPPSDSTLQRPAMSRFVEGFPGFPGGFFVTGPFVGTRNVPPAVPPVPYIPPEGPGPLQPFVPTGALIPEPRLFVPLALAVLWLLSRAVRFRKPLRRTTRY